jgi:hypothetical protein
VSAPEDTPDEAKAARVAAGRSLGARLDGLIARLARVPSWFGWTLFLGVIVATFPYGTAKATVLGVELHNWLTLWVLNLGIIGGAIVLAAGALFIVRAVLSYLEEGRWPQKAAGVDMGEVDGALDQVQRGADELSRGADAFRRMETQLEEAYNVIRYLMAEVDRARGASPSADPTSEAREDKGQP